MKTQGHEMQTSVDLADLVEVVSGPGPNLTVLLATESAVDNASHRNQVRWRAERDRLAEQGVPATVLEGIDPLVPDAHLEGQALFAVADNDGVRIAAHLPDLPFREFCVWDTLPALLDLVEARQRHPRHIRVTADRSGADITVIEGMATEDRETVSGATFRIQKVHAGGWSSRHYDERVENTWNSNAKDVADAIVRLAREHRPQIILVAGDTRATKLIEEALPPEYAAIIEPVDGSRSADGGPAIDPVEVERLLALSDATLSQELLSRALQPTTSDHRGVAGAAATVEALQRAQVDSLLVEPRDAKHGRAWFGSETGQISMSADELVAMGVQCPQEGSLVDAAVRAALISGAGVRVVAEPGRLPDGLGATLRWTDSHRQ